MAGRGCQSLDGGDDTRAPRYAAEPRLRMETPRERNCCQTQSLDVPSVWHTGVHTAGRAGPASLDATVQYPSMTKDQRGRVVIVGACVSLCGAGSQASCSLVGHAHKQSIILWASSSPLLDGGFNPVAGFS